MSDLFRSGMNRIPAMFLVFASALFSSAAEIGIQNSIVVEGTKKAEPASENNLDASFVRGEFMLDGKSDRELFGLLHLRFQSDFGNTAVATTVRQAYFKLPVRRLVLQAGRWYERYTPGVYFGRYLFGVAPAGSGSMTTNYTVVDGLRLSAPAAIIPKTDFIFGLLPQQPTFENVYTAFLFSTNFVPDLKMNIGVNLQAIAETGDRDHRFTTTAAYRIVEDLAVFLEYGITDLSDAGDNSWLMSGVDIPSGGILDLFRVEVELGNRSAENASVPAWIVILVEKWGNLTFQLNAGSDPAVLGSRNAGQLGAVFRTTATF